MIFPVPTLATVKLLAIKLCALCAALVVAYAWGHTSGASSRDAEIAARDAVAAATDTRYRQLEKEAQDAQAGYVAAFTRNRDAARAEWLRLQADAGRRRVSPVCPESGGADANSGNRVEVASGAGDRDLLPALVDALKAGEALEAGLALCQQELRQCAALR